MPQSNEGVLLVIGALFLLLGLLGGGFEISAIKVPPVGKYTRFVALALGTLVFGAGLYRLIFAPLPGVAFSPTPTTIAVIPTATAAPIPSSTAIPPTATFTPLPPTATATPLSEPTPTRAETPSAISAQLQDVRVEYDVTRFERKGMVIHVKLRVIGMKNVAGRVVAYFFQRGGAPLKDTNNTYMTVDGNVSASESFTPLEDSVDYDDLQVFLPYDELELGPGSYNLKFFVSVFDMRHTEKALVSSPDIFFDFNK